ncbi:hypothetical protein BXY82_2717 [Gelidibacter sediminis]|uniref:Uncharacterized protein n=1 Tax=Gelidibacter sediminis TaxID=1608710 RepID=A0A4R7PJA2_9FLAO|nr:hypothetical protein [Gelidibacter sediminis]TDU34397.1 hypothetical protein BXY82_2717 [Gelidibacter sediminis]
MKPRLFLNSTDIASITGYSQRNARNIMGWIRTEKGLSSKQAISIFHFCECFDFPIYIIYEYINNPDFNLIPINELEIYKAKAHQRAQPATPLDLSVFEPIINQPRKI